MTAVTAQAYLNAQRAQLGFVGGAPNGNHTPYGAFTGYQDQPWCGSFQLWAAAEVGLWLPPHVSPALVYTPAGAAAYKAAGRWAAPRELPIQVGAHVFYDWNGDGTIDHVECVESVLADGTFYTIGGNVNSAVQRVHRSTRYVVGFGLPSFAPPAPIPAPKPVPAVPRVSLSHVIAAAKHDGPAPGTPTEYKADVLPVEDALAVEGLLSRQYVDGSFGTLTVLAYRTWQQRCGFTGSAADGIPGQISLGKLGAKHGFTVGP